MASPSSGKDKKKDSKSNLKLDDYLHTKAAKWSSQNLSMFVVPALLTALIPTFLYFFVYDYRPDGLFELHYVTYLITLAAMVSGLLSGYTQIFVDTLHYLKTSFQSQSKIGEKQQKVFETQSKWWTIFYVNALFVLLFGLANFYAFRSSIPSTHFRFVLSTMVPAMAVHVCTNGTSTSEAKQ